MNFNTLDSSIKQAMHEELLNCAQQVGGINFFLQMIESIKAEKVNPLLKESMSFHYPKGTISWNKSIHKPTLTILFTALKKEDKEGDMIAGANPKDYKTIMNMMKALKPLEITVTPKEEECEEKGFSFLVLDTTQEKKTKISFLFKVIFFYNLGFAKQVLTYKKES